MQCQLDSLRELVITVPIDGFSKLRFEYTQRFFTIFNEKDGTLKPMTNKRTRYPTVLVVFDLMERKGILTCCRWRCKVSGIYHLWYYDLFFVLKKVMLFIYVKIFRPINPKLFIIFNYLWNESHILQINLEHQIFLFLFLFINQG